MPFSLPTTVLKQLPGKPLDQHGSVVKCLIRKGPGDLGDHWIWCAVDGPKVEVLPGARLLSIDWPPTPLERLETSLHDAWHAGVGFCQNVLAQTWQSTKRHAPKLLRRAILSAVTLLTVGAVRFVLAALVPTLVP